mmetsp:Transcript_23488/g.46762  ORF Transcript_23488/g.46762 Transcript_23488/m.46762 type:complete len:270 (-) Transcript_23488:226-1035(-)
MLVGALSSSCSTSSSTVAHDGLQVGQHIGSGGGPFKSRTHRDVVRRHVRRGQPGPDHAAPRLFRDVELPGADARQHFVCVPHLVETIHGVPRGTAIGEPAACRPGVCGIGRAQGVAVARDGGDVGQDRDAPVRDGGGDVPPCQVRTGRAGTEPRIKVPAHHQCVVLECSADFLQRGLELLHPVFRSSRVAFEVAVHHSDGAALAVGQGRGHGPAAVRCVHQREVGFLPECCDALRVKISFLVGLAQPGVTVLRKFRLVARFKVRELAFL